MCSCHILLSRVVVILFLSILIFPNLKPSYADASNTQVVSGILRQIISDNLDGSLQSQYYLDETNSTGARSGNRFLLKFEGDIPKTILPNLSIRLKAELLPEGKSLFISKENSNSIYTLPSTRTAFSLPTPYGNNTVLLLRINSIDGQPGCTASQMKSTLAEVSNMMHENSYGQFSYAPADAFDITVYDYASNCDIMRIAELARQASPVNPENYNHVIYVMGGNCPWAGKANMPGNEVWINGNNCDNHSVYAHELAHNLGMGHAGLDFDNDGHIDCEYCDRSDFMGYANFVGIQHNNAPHKVQMGWIIPRKVQSPGGIFQINSLESDPDSVLEVNTSDNNPYYISFRSPENSYYSTALNSEDKYRISISRFSPIDARSKKITVLDNGVSFKDQREGISITQLSTTSTSAVVAVSMGCEKSLPSALLSPPVLLTNTLDTPATYTLKIKNNDSQICSNPTSFEISTGGVVGIWAGMQNLIPTITLLPSSNSEIQLVVNAPLDIKDGNYPLDLSIKAEGRPDIKVSALYSIDRIPPSTPAGFKSTRIVRNKRRQWIPSFTWRHSTDYNKVSYRIFRNGTLIAETYLNRLTDTLSKNTRHIYQVQAVDAAGNKSALSKAVVIRKR